MEKRRKCKLKKGLILSLYFSINLQHDARQEWLVSMQISMIVFFSW